MITAKDFQDIIKAEREKAREFQMTALKARAEELLEEIHNDYDLIEERLAILDCQGCVDAMEEVKNMLEGRGFNVTYRSREELRIQW